MNMFNFVVPQNLIAQKPVEERDACRMMVLDKATGSISHKIFRNLPGLLSHGDVVVINVSRVIPARLRGHKSTGGRIDALFLEQKNNGHANYWNVLLRSSVNTGARILFPGGLSGIIIDKNIDGSFLMATEGPDVKTVLDQFGFMPLPPYIKRPQNGEEDNNLPDKEWYQTIYAKEPGSVASPTAGLHFTGALLGMLRENGVAIVEVTLHVGWGTFRRPGTGNGSSSPGMLPEKFEIGKESADKINTARVAGRKIVAVGTTTVRALETAAGNDGLVSPCSGETSLFIQPGHRFRIVDAIITNFHLPGYTPLYLAAAFAGEPLLEKAYHEAIREKYRFYSYGDAMLIL